MPPIRISPSALDNLSQCPCFVYKSYADDKPSAAQEGTLLHLSLETGDDDALNAEQQRSVQQTRDLVAAQLEAYLDWSNCPIDKRVELHEQKLKSSFGYNGKMDRCYVNLVSGKGMCVDMKQGRAGLIADAIDSFQMMAYFDIMAVRLPGLLKEVRVMLSSPRTNEVSSHDYSIDDLPRVRAMIQKVIDDAEDPLKEPRFSDSLCPKCQNLDRCRVAKKDVLAPLSATALAISPELLLKPVDQLTVQELAENRAAMDLLENWAAVRKPAIDQRIFTENLEIPGYARVTKNGAPFIPAEMSTRAWELLKGDLTPEEYISVCGKPKLGSIIELLANGQPGESLADRMEAAKIHMFDVLEEITACSKSSQYLRRKSKLSSKLLTQ